MNNRKKQHNNEYKKIQKDPMIDVYSKKEGRKRYKETKENWTNIQRKEPE